MAPVMTVLHEGSLRSGGGGIGGEQLPAPQAGLFAAITKGMFSGEGALPKEMVAWGAAIGVLMLIVDRLLARLGSRLRLHVMPVAVGMYLPFGLSVPILLGGVVRALVDRAGSADGERRAQRGVLVASGLIAGESLLGVLLGFFAYQGIALLSSADWLLLRTGLSESAGNAVIEGMSVLALCGVAWTLWRWSNR